MKKLVMILAIAMLALPAGAADWRQVATDTNGSIIYLDRSSIAANRGIVQYWLKVLLKNQNNLASANRYYKGTRVWYMLYKTEEDCNGTSTLFPMEETILYGTKGQVLHSTGPIPAMPASPAPDTVGEAIHNAVCNSTVARRLVR
jgi:hypothetical protein